MASLPTKTFRLLTVNTFPARAQAVVGRVAARLQDRYTIEHVGNCASIDEVKERVLALDPDLVFCASVWSPEESATIQALARAAKPGIRTHATPAGLQLQGGADAVVAHLTETLPKLLG